MHNCSNTLDASQKILLGYYDLRGKIQVCRLLCQYTKLPYTNVFFTPPSWACFRATQTLGSTFEELPFLKDKDFLVNETYPICYYIIKKVNRDDLLGKTIEDNTIVDMFIWKAEVAALIISEFVRLRDHNIESKNEQMRMFWHKRLQKKVKYIEDNTKQSFYLGYLSLIDFYIYEMMNLVYMFYPQKINEFPKIVKIHQNMANIPEIREYEQSDRAIRNYNPIEFYQKWMQPANR